MKAPRSVEEIEALCGITCFVWFDDRLEEPVKECKILDIRIVPGRCVISVQEPNQIVHECDPSMLHQTFAEAAVSFNTYLESKKIETWPGKEPD